MDRPGSCLAIFCRAERSWTARVRRSKAFSLDHGLAARLPDRGQNLRQAYPDSKPDAKIGVLYQNDDFGKDYLTGLKHVLGANHAGMIVKETSYETSEPTVDSQVVTLQGSGADVFVIAATPKFAAQAIRKSYDLGWNAVRYVSIVSVSIATVLKPAGLEKSKGLITAYYGKDPTDARWKDDAGMKEWAAFCAKYLTPTDFIDSNALYAYGAGGTMIQVLKQCGNDLSRDNIMKQ